MRLRRLRYFVKIAEVGNIHRAAEELHVAQPALTRQIMQLEADLRTQLFERLPRGMRLTASGESFLAGAKQVIAQFDELMQSAQDNSSNPFGTISVAFEDSVSQNPMIAKSLQMVRKSYPNIKVNLLPLSERHQMERLRNREIDLGFAYDNCGEFASHRELDCLVLSKDDLVLVVPQDHPLAVKSKIVIDDLVDEPFVMIAKEKAPKLGYKNLIDTCVRAGFAPDIIQEVPSIDGLFNLVSVGIGLTLCARGVRASLPANVMMRSVEALNMSFDFTLMWRRHSQSAATHRFVEVVKSIQRSSKLADIAARPVLDISSFGANGRLPH